jgi:hypothetical protein
MTRFWKLLLAAGVLAAFASPALAAGKAPGKPARDATDEEDDEEADLTSQTPQTPVDNKPVVEVARGWYMQADPGSFDYLGLIPTPGFPNPFGKGVSWGNSIRLHVGDDIVTTRHFGLSAQFTFWQVVNKGIYVPEALPTQGATRSFLYEASVRPTVMIGSAGRFNIYGRAGAGVGFLQKARAEEPVEGLYSSFSTGLAPKPFFGGGLGVEYYTRLSHFSFTFVEANVLYFPGLDIAFAVNFAGFKYTF